VLVFEKSVIKSPETSLGQDLKATVELSTILPEAISTSPFMRLAGVEVLRKFLVLKISTSIGEAVANPRMASEEMILNIRIFKL
jgi:hypothetical protein